MRRLRYSCLFRLSMWRAYHVTNNKNKHRWAQDPPPVTESLSSAFHPFPLLSVISPKADPPPPPPPPQMGILRANPGDQRSSPLDPGSSLLFFQRVILTTT